MKDLVFIGQKTNTNRDMIEMLEEMFQIDFVETTTEAVRKRIQRETPALILLSLGEDPIEEAKIINLLNMDFINIPVVTLGTEYESIPYNRYYESSQFEKVIRPISNRALLDICCSMANVEQDIFESTDKKHILVVDDNALTLRNIKKMLSDKYSVAVAISGVQAFASIGRQKPDLILLDYAMPVTDGKMVFEMLRGDMELSKIPVVFLTSVADEKVVFELLSMKPAGYFLKPVNQKKLLETIEAIV